ncbi:pPIWI_RE module domain-containing protein [Streptomyces sp. NBC_01483]|uniref:pPIWI_RE module domain-containing protein n=1 Tax=Streptomyces sp. NBC_01483 TaxID=2903883 RepID=UPI002E355B66|nr:DUF3962 domain-containing protein [Streptomyces sp. NBC_01483]
MKRKEWWFSVVLNISLQTTPFDPRPRLHLHADHPRKEGSDLGQVLRSANSAANFDTGGYCTVGPVVYHSTADGPPAQTRPTPPQAPDN